MNIIIFLKQGQEDADGEHGPHVWWYQEEVNPRRRERYLVSRINMRPRIGARARFGKRAGGSTGCIFL